jgi:hypothetical protein
MWPQPSNIRGLSKSPGTPSNPVTNEWVAGGPGLDFETWVFRLGGSWGKRLLVPWRLVVGWVWTADPSAPLRSGRDDKCGLGVSGLRLVRGRLLPLLSRLGGGGKRNAESIGPKSCSGDFLRRRLTQAAGRLCQHVSPLRHGERQPSTSNHLPRLSFAPQNPGLKSETWATRLPLGKLH